MSPDPEYGSKLERWLEVLREAARRPGEVVVLLLDEMGYYRWPEPCRDWSSLAPAPAPIADTGLVNNSQWCLIGALDALTGRVHYLDNYIAGRKQLIAFYKQLAGAYPKAEHQ